MSLDLEWIRARLPEREIVWCDVAGSTMREARRLAANGCASGTVALAEEQLAGEGRYGRRWHSERESGLYVSVVLRVPLSVEAMPALTLALGLATAQAITRTTGFGCDLRWPNDILLEGKKCAGILAQLEDSAIIAGVGINVNHVSFPQELDQVATSLRLVTGRCQSREELLVQLIEAVDSFCGLVTKGQVQAILRMFSRASTSVDGRRVKVHQGDSILEGTTEGLDSSGFLILRKDDGTRSLILSGGVRPA